MTTPQRPDDSVNTALAVTKDDMASLTPAQRAAIATRKNANIVAAQIAGTNWGKGVDVATQRAVSDWGQRNAIDVTTEIHILGGGIYLNAQFYINRGIDLINAGKVLDYNQRFINHDPQLDAILKEVLPADASEEERTELRAAQLAARQEIRERRELRTKYGVPADANIKAAVLTEITLARLPHSPFVGVKWTPHGDDDPVGRKFPQETALTRSARRAWKQCARQLPEIQRFVVGAEEDAAETVEHLLEAHADREAKAASVAASETKQITSGGIPQAEYVKTSAEAAPLASSELLARMAKMAPGRDPYVEPGTESIPTPFDPGTGDDDDLPAGTSGPESTLTGPATPTLFGTSEPMEPTAEERAAREAAEEEEIRAEDRRLAAEEENRGKRRAS